LFPYTTLFRSRASRDAFAARVELHHGEPLYVGGASHLAAEQEAFASTSASGLLELLEQHVVLCALLRELLGPGLTVRIGAENELADLRECSLVLAPYIVEGEAVGTVGVLGPTRMDYRTAQAVRHVRSGRRGRGRQPVRTGRLRPQRLVRRVLQRRRIRGPDIGGRSVARSRRGDGYAAHAPGGREGRAANRRDAHAGGVR